MRKDRFEKRLTNIPAPIWSTIAKIDGWKGQWIAGARLNPQTLGRLKRSVLITSAGASTRIEGAKLSDEDVEKLMKGISIKKWSDRDQQEVKGYYELLENVFNSWKHLKFNESLIKHFHKELLRYVGKDERHRGNYKTTNNRVEMIDAQGKSIGVVFDTTPAYLTLKEMQELVEWTVAGLKKQRHHPLLVIGNFVVEFLKIHPFLDGNGRLSRVLTNLLLLQAGYDYIPYVSHEKLVEQKKTEYYLALRKTQKTFKTQKESIETWLEFFLLIILTQSESAVSLLSKENIERILSPKQLAVWKYLETVNEATPAEITMHSGVTRPTVNQALDRLLRLKRVERLGQGRSTRYQKTGSNRF